MIVPNNERVIVKRFTNEDVKTSAILLPGQLKAGENLFVGKILHPGNTKFQKGQIVYYSEYSASKLVDLTKALKGEETVTEAAKTELFVVAEDDIMAFDDELESGNDPK